MLKLSSSSSSSSIYPWKYHIFLSFSGEERTNFADHVCCALRQRGIKTFRDDNNLVRGEEIKPGLLEAIERSWGSIIVFSKGYVYSNWCLDELVKIVKQSDERGHQVFPIFYRVEVTDLKHQTNSVAEAFAKHEGKYKDNEEKIQRWRDTLFKASSIAGSVLRPHEYESDFIKKIIDDISTKLSESRSHWEELCPILNADVPIIGICGKTGISRTNLARVAYAEMSPCFEAKIFLTEVGKVSTENGLVSLQKLLLSQISPEETFDFSNIDEGREIISQKLLQMKNVLIVVNDANDIQQLKCILGKREWFGVGSKIIITARNEQLLRSFRMDDDSNLTTTYAESIHLKIVIKLQMHCYKCKTKALKIVAAAIGVTSVALHGENKDQVLVIGQGIDGVHLTTLLRKRLRHADLMSVEKGIVRDTVKPFVLRLNPKEEESAAFAPQDASPAHPVGPKLEILPPPSPPAAGVSQFAPEVHQVMVALLHTIAAQVQAGQIPLTPPAPPVPSVALVPAAPVPVTSIIPPAVVAPALPNISRSLKEARLLGCIAFQGDLDPSAAKNWVRRVTKIFAEMEIDDMMKLRIVIHLLEGRAQSWWELVTARYTDPLTWTDFLREFDEQYYTEFHQLEKRREFLSLRQGSMTVEEYETKFNELVPYVPDLVRNGRDQAIYFEKGLRIEIRKSMLGANRESYQKMVQSALWTEKLAFESRKAREAFARKCSSGSFSGQFAKKGKSIPQISVGGGSAMSVGSVRPVSQPVPRPFCFGVSGNPGQGRSVVVFSDGRICASCGRFHSGPCREPIRCYNCGQAGHVRSSCPFLGRARSPSSGRFDGRRPPQTSTQQRSGTAFRAEAGSSAPTTDTPLGQTRIFTVTWDEAQTRPEVVTGGEIFRKGKEPAIEGQD